MAVGNTIIKFETFDCCSCNESTILASIRFDIILKGTVSAFEMVITLYETKSLFRFSPDYGEKQRETLIIQEKLRIGGIAPQRSSK